LLSSSVHVRFRVRSTAVCLEMICACSHQCSCCFPGPLLRAGLYHIQLDERCDIRRFSLVSGGHWASCVHRQLGRRGFPCQLKVQRLDRAQRYRERGCLHIARRSQIGSECYVFQLGQLSTHEQSRPERLRPASSIWKANRFSVQF
jgi:hypothetical protein